MATIKPYQFKKEIIVDTPIAQAWQTLSDTNAMNRALGFPVVSFASPEPKGQLVVRQATARFFGMRLRWLEFPFEFTRERQFSVLREMKKGPIKKLWGGLSFLPFEQNPNQTRITCFCFIQPSGFFSKPIAKLIGNSLIRFSDRKLKKIVHAAKSDFRVPVQFRNQSKASHQRLTKIIEHLGQSLPINGVHLKLLESHVRQNPDSDVVSMQPYRLADVWGQDRKDILKLFLYATLGGLLDLDWVFICPNCKISKADFSTFSKLEEQFHCDFCELDFNANLDQNTELRFNVRRDIRPAAAQTFCIGNPANFPHIYAQVIIPAGESRMIELPVRAKDLRLRAVRKKATVNVEVTNGVGALPSVVFKDEQFNVKKVAVGNNPLQLKIVNDTYDFIICVLENPNLDNFAVSALTVSMMREFRANFGREILFPGNQIGISNICVLFTDLKSSTQMYEDIGDAQAFGRVFKHFSWLEKIIAEFEGIVIKTIGDAIMAYFPGAENALKASLEMQKQLQQFNTQNNFQPGIILKIGLHEGPAIAINANDKQDFFGKTINLAVRIQDQGHGDDVVIAKNIFERDEIQKIIAAQKCRSEKFKAKLKGFKEDLELYRLTF